MTHTTLNTTEGRVCPNCQADDIRFDDYDFGTDTQTGYHDTGTRFMCRCCGEIGEIEDLGIPEEPYCGKVTHLIHESVINHTGAHAMLAAVKAHLDICPVCGPKYEEAARIPVLEPITVKVATLSAPEFLAAVDEAEEERDFGRVA